MVVVNTRNKINILQGMNHGYFYVLVMFVAIYVFLRKINEILTVHARLAWHGYSITSQICPYFLAIIFRPIPRNLKI